LQTRAFLEQLAKSLQKTSLVDAEREHLPPSSYQQFLKTLRLLPGAVITDFDAHYRNKSVARFFPSGPGVE
jgi:hypothetical protein